MATNDGLDKTSFDGVIATKVPLKGVEERMVSA